MEVKKAIFRTESRAQGENDRSKKSPLGKQKKNHAHGLLPHFAAKGAAEIHHCQMRERGNVRRE